MPSISITDPDKVTILKLGASTVPKVGGDVDLSKFTSLNRFEAVDLNLNSVVGFDKLQDMQFISINYNILATDPLPSFHDTSLTHFYMNDPVQGPTDIVDGWSIPSSVVAFQATNSDLGPARLKILTAFWDAFKDETGVRATNRGAITFFGTGDALVGTTPLLAPYASITVDVAKALLVSPAVKFLFVNGF
jgi:hypothetical protein